MERELKNSQDWSRIYKIGTVLLFLIYPLAALPFICIEIYNRKRYAFSLLAIYLGYFAMLYPPTGDLYRYYQSFVLYSTLSFSELLNVLTNMMDILQPFLFWGVAKLGMTCDSVRFLYLYIACELIFTMYYELTEGNGKPKNLNFLLFILLLMFLRFERYTVRFGMSTVFFVFGWYRIFFFNKRSFWLLILLAILNHFSFILPTLALIGARCISFRPKRWVFLSLFVGTFLLSGDYISSIISLLPFNENVINHLLAYTDGYWAGDFLEDHSAMFNLGRNLLKFPFFLFTLLLLKDFKEDQVTGTVVMSMVLVFIFSAFVTIQSRMEQIYVLQALVLLLKQGGDFLMNRKYARLAVICGCFYLFVCTWTIRRELSISQEYKLLYPSYCIWTAPYEEDWVNTMVFTDGAPDVKF